MKELVIYAGVDYTWVWSKPTDGSTPQIQMEVTPVGEQKIIAVFGTAHELSMTHETGEPERVTVRSR